MNEPSSVAKIRERLGVEAPAEPHWSEKVDLATRLQNRSITAQVCVKAGATVTAALIAVGAWAHVSDPAKVARAIARELLAEAEAYIYKDKKPRRRARKPMKEVADK
jgi:hypothetical protein